MGSWSCDRHRGCDRRAPERRRAAGTSAPSVRTVNPIPLSSRAKPSDREGGHALGAEGGVQRGRQRGLGDPDLARRLATGFLVCGSIAARPCRWSGCRWRRGSWPLCESLSPPVASSAWLRMRPRRLGSAAVSTAVRGSSSRRCRRSARRPSVRTWLRPPNRCRCRRADGDEDDAADAAAVLQGLRMRVSLDWCVWSRVTAGSGLRPAARRPRRP